MAQKTHVTHFAAVQTSSSRLSVLSFCCVLHCYLELPENAYWIRTYTYSSSTGQFRWTSTMTRNISWTRMTFSNIPQQKSCGTSDLNLCCGSFEVCISSLLPGYCSWSQFTQITCSYPSSRRLWVFVALIILHTHKVAGIGELSDVTTTNFSYFLKLSCSFYNPSACTYSCSPPQKDTKTHCPNHEIWV